MAQYKQGLASTTAGSTTVTFSGTELLTYATVGGLFCIDGDNTTYTIASIVSDTELTLTAPYPETKTSVAFTITNDFTPNYNLPLIDSGDRNTAPIVKDDMTKIDQQMKENADGVAKLESRVKAYQSGTHITDQNDNPFLKSNGSYAILTHPVNDTRFTAKGAFLEGHINGKSVYTQLEQDVRFAGYDTNGNVQWRFRIGGSPARMWLAPLDVNSGNWNWSREISYYGTPADGNPSWYIEQPSYKTPTPINGCSLYGGWSKNAIWKDIEGYVNFSLMIKMPTGTTSTDIATIDQPTLRPVGNNETFPAVVRLDASSNFVIGVVYIFQNGNIKAVWNGTTTSDISYVAVTGKYWRGV